MIIGIALILLPAAAANMAPVFVRRIPLLATPLDLGYAYNGVRMLGDNKTVRGLVTGIFASTAVMLVLTSLAETLAPYALIDYGTLDPLTWGPLIGFGALFGDAVKSFFKRQRGIPPGDSWPPYDQVDWVVGALLVLMPVAILPISAYLLALFLGGLLHPVVNIAGYYLRLKPSML